MSTEYDTHCGRVDVVGDAIFVRAEVEAVVAVAYRGGQQLPDVPVAVGGLPGSSTGGAWKQTTVDSGYSQHSIEQSQRRKIQWATCMRKIQWATCPWGLSSESLCRPMHLALREKRLCSWGPGGAGEDTIDPSHRGQAGPPSTSAYVDLWWWWWWGGAAVYLRWDGRNFSAC